MELNFIYLINIKLEVIKKRQKTIKNLLPRYGAVTMRNSNHLVDELFEIGGFYKVLEEYHNHSLIRIHQDQIILSHAIDTCVHILAKHLNKSASR